MPKRDKNKSTKKIVCKKTPLNYLKIYHLPFACRSETQPFIYDTLNNDQLYSCINPINQCDYIKEKRNLRSEINFKICMKELMITFKNMSLCEKLKRGAIDEGKYNKIFNVKNEKRRIEIRKGDDNL